MGSINVRVRCTLEVPYELLKPMLGLSEAGAAGLFKAFLTGFLIPTNIRVTRVSISNHDIKKIEGDK